MTKEKALRKREKAPPFFIYNPGRSAFRREENPRMPWEIASARGNST